MKNYLFSIALLLFGFLFAVIHTAPALTDANDADNNDVLAQDSLGAASEQYYSYDSPTGNTLVARNVDDVLEESTANEDQIVDPTQVRPWPPRPWPPSPWPPRPWPPSPWPPRPWPPRPWPPRPWPRDDRPEM